MNISIKLIILTIISSFALTGCLSSQALYFHERTKFGLSAQIKPEDPQEKVGVHIGFKRRIVAIVPPKKLSPATGNAIDNANQSIADASNGTKEPARQRDTNEENNKNADPSITNANNGTKEPAKQTGTNEEKNKKANPSIANASNGTTKPEIKTDKELEKIKKEADLYHEGEALSLVSTFDVTANPMKGVHIHNNFASGKAAKNLVAVSNEVYANRENLKKFKQFLKEAKEKAALKKNSEKVTPEKVTNLTTPNNLAPKVNYQEPNSYGHQLLLTSSRTYQVDRIAEVAQLTPEAIANKCLPKKEKAEKTRNKCELTWLGDLARKKEMGFIETLSFIDNVIEKEKRQVCLDKLVEKGPDCGEFILTTLAGEYEPKITKEIENNIKKITSLKKSGIDKLLKHLDQIEDDLAFPLNILAGIGKSFLETIGVNIGTISVAELDACSRSKDTCTNTEVKKMLKKIEENKKVSECAKDPDNCSVEDKDESLKILMKDRKG